MAQGFKDRLEQYEILEESQRYFMMVATAERKFLVRHKLSHQNFELRVIDKDAAELCLE